MQEMPILLPQPRRIDLRSGVWRCDPFAPKFKVDPNFGHPQGYQLSVSTDGVEIVGDAIGVHHAHRTIAQLLSLYGDNIPCMVIEDWPDFLVRGVMLDVSRDKVPTIATLKSLIAKLASWKINQIQLYIEHTFAYRDHPEVWKDASPFTGEEIRELDTFCRQHFVDLVPNQNSFGHMERWLKHPRYLPLAEAAEGAQTPWGFFWKGPFSLCPTDPKSVELLRELYAELLPNFSSKLFNVGCDETFDIGKGRSAALCKERGTTRVYLDLVKQVHELVKANGRTMMFWGDIIKAHPEMIHELDGAIGLVWGYEADSPFDAECAAFQKAGVPFYVCPGTSSWCSIAGRTDNMIANAKSAAKNGLAHGAAGYLMTDWGDHGHLQYLPISYAGFAAGAAFSWCLDSNSDLPLADVLDFHVFMDKAKVMGKLACDLGNVYAVTGRLKQNSSSLFRILVPPQTPWEAAAGLSAEGIDAAEEAIDIAIAPLAEARMMTDDRELVTAEFRNAAATLKFACDLGRRELGMSTNAGTAESLESIIEEHRRLWLARNRPGGLSDSVSRLEALKTARHGNCDAISIRPTTVETIRPLRHSVLRAGLPLEAAIFDGDDEPASRHIGAFATSDAIVGCVTIVQRDWNGDPAWQLRGMAIDADLRGKGVGRLLLVAVDQIVRDSQHSRILWCNARTPAVGFYAALGWAKVGDELEIETAGSHFRMLKRV